MSNTRRENSNVIFTSEKLDKSDELVDTVNKLTINNSPYYESNIATESGAQCDLTCNLETIPDTNNGNEPVTHTSDGNFEQKN